MSIFLFENIFVYAALRKDGTRVRTFFSLVLFGTFQQMCIFASSLTKKQKTTIMQNFKISDFNRLTPSNALESKFRKLIDDLYTIRFDEHANIIDAIDLYVDDFEEINPLRNVFLTPMNKKRIDYLCYELIQSMKDYLLQICSDMSNQRAPWKYELKRSTHYINSLINEVENILL